MLILDFYVDEPSCLGVPPYVSPYVRYSAGALVGSGISQDKIEYLTVDQWRGMDRTLPRDYELVVVIAGSTVPGRYLGGKIGTIRDVHDLLNYRRKHHPGGVTILGGPIRHAATEFRKQIQEAGGLLIDGDVEYYVHKFASHPRGPAAAARSFIEDQLPTGEKRTYQSSDRWACDGAFITHIHPGFPYLMMEMETYRGCTRTPHCSFCTESLYGTVEFRPLRGIHDEAAELNRMGNYYFRLGRQADILTYLHKPGSLIRGFPEPSVENIEALYSGFRKAAPDLRVLHLDNVNPGGIAAHPQQSKEALEIIAQYNTEGDTAAMGMESADPMVVRKNRLKADADQVFEAVRIVNEAGAKRKYGIPSILPGLNFIQGLPGESEDTFRLNYEFMRRVLDAGYLLRRTNIRRVIPYEGTPLEAGVDDGNLAGESERSAHAKKLKREKNGRKGQKNHDSRLDNRFRYYRDKIREEIDRIMLDRVFPVGTIIRDVLVEEKLPGKFLGRPLGSYPVTVRIPDGDPGANRAWENGESVSVIITGSEERSLSALTIPLCINLLNEISLRTIPGAGKKRASKIRSAVPLSNPDELRAILEGPIFCDDTYLNFDVS